MLKKMMLLVMAVGALVAFAAPAAQADVQLTDQDGNPLTVGSEFTATSTNLVMKFNQPAPFPRLECTKLTLHLTVGTNGPNHVVIQPHPGHPGSTATTEGCELNLNGTTKLPATVTDGTVGELTIDTWGTGEATMTVTTDVPAAGLANCAFEGKTHRLATNGTNILHVGPSVLNKEPPSPANCANSGTVEGSFSLENADGAVTINAVNTE